MASGLVPVHCDTACRVTHLVWSVVHGPLCIGHGCCCCCYDLCAVQIRAQQLPCHTQHCTAVCRYLSGKIWSVVLAYVCRAPQLLP